MNNYFFSHKVVKCKHYAWWYGPSNIKVQSLHCLCPLRMPTMANTPHEKPLIFQLSALVSLPRGKSSTRVWERVRVQWAQGGAGPQGEGKWRVNEVQFWMKHFLRADYSLFNELAPSPSSPLHRHHQPLLLTRYQQSQLITVCEFTFTAPGTQSFRILSNSTRIRKVCSHTAGEDSAKTLNHEARMCRKAWFKGVK